MQQSNNITTRKVGRPSVLTPDVTVNLVAALQVGLPDRIACRAAGISKTSFYKLLKESEEFRVTIERARIIPTFLASQIIFDILYDTVREENGQKRKYSLSLSGKTARWYLERKDPENWGRFTCKESCCEERRWRQREFEAGRDPDTGENLTQQLTPSSDKT